MTDLKYAVVHEYLDSETKDITFDLVKPTYNYNDALKIAVSDNIENYFMTNVDYWPSSIVETYRDTGSLIYGDYLDIYNSFFPLFSYKLGSSDIAYDLSNSIFGIGYHVVDLLDMPYQLTYLLDDTLNKNLKKASKKSKKKATKRRKKIKGKGKEDIDMNEIVYGGSFKSFAGGFETNEIVEGGIDDNEIVGGGVEEFAGWGKTKDKSKEESEEESEEESGDESLDSCITSCKSKFSANTDEKEESEEVGEIEEVKGEMAGGLYDDGFY